MLAFADPEVVRRTDEYPGGVVWEGLGRGNASWDDVDAQGVEVQEGAVGEAISQARIARGCQLGLMELIRLTCRS